MDWIGIMPRVVFPCYLKDWWRVKDELHTLKTECALKEVFELKDLAYRHQKISDINQGILEEIQVPLNETVYIGLVNYFQKYATQDETEQFVKITFPSIIDFALEIETYLPTDGISISEQQNEGTTEISRRLCCCIIACSFLCLFPEDNRGRGTKLNIINFTDYFRHLHLPSQRAKFKCVLHYFDRVMAEKNRLTGTLIFSRQVIKQEELPTLDTWLNCPAELCMVEVHPDGLIEDSSSHAVEVDFANRFIGGGVLSRGRVQEEIRFTVCPELMVSMLFMECMDNNEAILIQGYEQFSAVQGYAAGLKFVGDHVDKCEVDERGNQRTLLCAIDAVSYKNICDPTAQFLDHCVLRDLNKAFTGFCTPFSLPAGMQLRCQSQESYVTAQEEQDSESAKSDQESGWQSNPHIDTFVEQLLQGVIALAVSEASKHALPKEERFGLPSSTGDHFHLQRQSSMDHLEVNFRDWYANYRRRSSNLSDLSSRRSSYDLASRRSSACSRGGYSSEYSSELEEYDNYQSEPKYKYHTITEEVGSGLVHEFAACLAASLLQEGAVEASRVTPPPQEFHGTPPEFDIKRPLPIRISTASLSTLDSVENEEAIAREDFIRQYVDRLFETVWPFDTEHDAKEKCVSESHSEVLARILEEEGVNKKQDVSAVDESETLESGEMKTSDTVDENLLLAVADRMVETAFEEALLEFRFMYMTCGVGKTSLPNTLTPSESSQSDHSTDIMDQSAVVSSESSQSGTSSDFNLVQASKMADQLMTTLFSKGKNSISVSPVMKHAKQETLPGLASCDTNLLTVDNPSNHSHSTSSSDSDNSAVKKQEEFSILADKVSGGLTARVGSNDKLASDELVSSVLNMSKDSGNGDGSLGYQHSKEANESSCSDLSRSPAKWDEVRNRSDSKSSCLKSSNTQFANVHSSSPTRLEDTASPALLGTSDTKSVDAFEVSRPSSTSPSKHHVSPTFLERRHVPKLVSQKSADSDKSRLLDTGLSDQRHHLSSESSISSAGALGRSKPLGTKMAAPYHVPTHQERLKMKQGHLFPHGSKKNYDQFANCLSRDLLTNAFLQVQEHDGPIVYPRRSSEPIQISNGAALQRYENSLHSKDGRSQKSKTDEDISSFEDDWMQQFSSRSSSGFRDPVLSRFAEELMKVNVSVPPLQLAVTTSDNISVTSSSQSVCSTFSSFRDPLLASFEEELLKTNDKKVLCTRMSWSKMKGSKCSPRESGNSNNSSSSQESRKYLNVSASVDSEGSALSGKSSSSNNQFKSVSSFADLLSTRVICEALTVIRKHVVKSQNNKTESAKYSVDIFSDMLAKSVLKLAMTVQELKNPDLLEQNKMVKWSSENKCLHYSEEENMDSSDLDTSRERELSESGHESVEFEDALDVPYRRLEEFADVLASKVLVNSVAILRREHLCIWRRQYGRPVATGNWGCGAFGGDPQLKCLIQWMAASYAGCPGMLYYTFRHHKMDRLQDIIDVIQDRQWDVAKLMQVVRRYCIIAQNEINLNGTVSRDLFDIIIQGEIFPGVS